VSNFRREATIYVTDIRPGNEFDAFVLSGLDYSERFPVGCRHIFIGEIATVIVVCDFAKIPRNLALEIAARYLTGKCKIARIEFPQPTPELKEILVREQRRKDKNYGIKKLS